MDWPSASLFHSHYLIFLPVALATVTLAFPTNSAISGTNLNIVSVASTLNNLESFFTLLWFGSGCLWHCSLTSKLPFALRAERVGDGVLGFECRCLAATVLAESFKSGPKPWGALWGLGGLYGVLGGLGEPWETMTAVPCGGRLLIAATMPSAPTSLWDRELWLCTNLLRRLGLCFLKKTSLIWEETCRIDNMLMKKSIESPNEKTLEHLRKQADGVLAGHVLWVGCVWQCPHSPRVPCLWFHLSVVQKQ